MCGICGVISSQRIDFEPVKRMQNAMRHRGPDGEGEYFAENIALAMRRLSIIDLVSGWQPLYNEDDSLILIANGEIYNYLELRAPLIARGHVFKTNSDCETILHLYEEYGWDCVIHLRGMFAFALWDSHKRRLLFARDRMGEKPLYLFEQAGQIVFASELKALVSSGLVPFELDPAAVDLFFHYHYIPEPDTAIKGVRKLPAAHRLNIDLDPWKVSENSYWDMTEASLVEGDPGQVIRQELETISELVIRSDVPVGVALSGGLDSSAIAALASKKYPGKMQVFSIGYTGCPPSDERRDAQRLAAYLDLPFHSVEITPDEVVGFFPELMYWNDDPIADIAGYGYYAVSKLAREHNVPVLLQGQGGDELFLGYTWVQQALQESMQKYRLWKDGPVKGLRQYLWWERPDFSSPQFFKQWAKSMLGIGSGVNRYIRHLGTPLDRLIFYDAYPDFLTAFANQHSLYAQPFRDELSATRAYDLFTFPQPWPQLDILITRLICQTYLLENGIAQGDRLSMASSIELRLPLVDYRFVETIIGLRKAHPNEKLPYKSWLKSALTGILPEWVLDRRKRGFEPPVMDWHQALFAAYGTSLADGYLVQHGILNPDSARLLAQGEFPRRAIMPPSFNALVLEMWCRRFSSLVENIR